jgi:hypothetical protein
MRPILTIALALALVMAVCSGCSSDTGSSSESGKDTNVELENPQVQIWIKDNTPPPTWGGCVHAGDRFVRWP